MGLFKTIIDALQSGMRTDPGPSLSEKKQREKVFELVKEIKESKKQDK